jgi:hypothetical protein
MATKIPRKKLSKNAEAIEPTGQPKRRWVRNTELAMYLGISKMTLWRLKNVPGFDFPPAAVVNGTQFNDLNEVDKWMEARVPSEASS